MTDLSNVQVMQFTWRDGLEIGVVALMFCCVLVLIHGIRALRILAGIVVLLALYAITSLLQLTMISCLLGLVFTYGVLAVLVIFQSELRAALAQTGQSLVTHLFRRVNLGPVDDEIADAVDRLARSGVGVIRAMERHLPLTDLIASGLLLPAKVSADLLTTFFTPYSPLHDGAVIIRGATMVGAGCIFPRLQGTVGHRSLATRHRAAFGLAKKTDATVFSVPKKRPSSRWRAVASCTCA